MRITKFTAQEYLRCAASPIYFMEHYATVNSHNGICHLTLDDEQKAWIDYYQRVNAAFLYEKRQSGTSTVTMNYLLWLALFDDEKRIFVGSRSNSNAVDLLRVSHESWESLPDFLKQRGSASSRKITFENGSVIEVGNFDPNRLRGHSYDVVYADQLAYSPYSRRTEFYSAAEPATSRCGKYIETNTGVGM